MKWSSVIILCGTILSFSWKDNKEVGNGYQLPKISPVILDAYKKLLTPDSQITIRSTL